MADRETSSSISTLAALVLQMRPQDGRSRNMIPEAENDLFVPAQQYNELLHDAKRIAGSALSQDQTPGQDDHAARSEEIRDSSRSLRLALAGAYATKIDDEDAMRIAQGLQAGKSEPELGLETVPIGIVYAAMFEFAKARNA